jgi:uncharacterized protein YbaP (TraB family)
MGARRARGNRQRRCALPGPARKKDAGMTELTDTDMPHASAAASSKDHMGRRPANSVMHAFSMDWPWILALVLLMAFCLGQMSGAINNYFNPPRISEPAPQ